MKLTICGLKDRTAWEDAGIRLPQYDAEKVADRTKACPRWIHFGAGNIFRHGNLCIRDGNLNMQTVGKNVFDYSVNN